MNKRLVILLVVLAAAAAALAAWRLREPPVPASPAVATVNGTAITQKELDIRVTSLLPMASYHGNVSPDKLASLRRAALDELILEELVWQDARRQGLSPDATAVEAELDDMKRRFDSGEAFEAALREDGVALDTYRKFLARKVLVRAERQKRSALHDPTEAEIASYYAANGAEFVRPERVRLQEIALKVDPAGTQADERAVKARADAVARRLRGGESFELVAEEASQDAYAVKGGNLGWVHKGRLDRDLEQAAFAAPVGEIGRARSIHGFHVFRVLEREPARQLTLDEARPLIVDRLQRTERDARRQAWEDGLRKPARIEILDQVLRDATPAELPTFEGPAGQPSAAPAPAAQPAH